MVFWAVMEYKKTTKSLSLQFQKFPCGAVKSFSHVRLDVFGDSWDKATESHRISNECWAKNTWIWSLIVIFTPGFQQSARVSCHRLRLAPLYSVRFERWLTSLLCRPPPLLTQHFTHRHVFFFLSVISFWRWDCESARVRLSLTFTVEWLRVFSSFFFLLFVLASKTKSTAVKWELCVTAFSQTSWLMFILLMELAGWGVYMAPSPPFIFQHQQSTPSAALISSKIMFFVHVFFF